MVNYTNNLSSIKLNSLWHNMYDRCYSKRYHDRSPQYIGCSMCDDWLDDQATFKEWARENYYTIDDEQIDLDKDILVKGNKIYSPKTCIFVPHSINAYFNNLVRDPVYIKSLDQWKMEICIEGKNVTIGYFDTKDEAKEAYIKHKEASILAKADLYKDRIPRKLYNAMIKWRIELSDWHD